MKKRDGRVSYSVHPSPILGDGQMDALKDGQDGRGMDARWTAIWANVRLMPCVLSRLQIAAAFPGRCRFALMAGSVAPWSI
jgi:hypothetical protein